MDYKKASKDIPKTIEPVLNKLVHPHQTGFVKGRYIGENIRLISDIMEQTKSINGTGVLISVDVSAIPFFIVPKHQQPQGSLRFSSATFSVSSKFLYLLLFSISFSAMFLSDGIVISISLQVGYYYCY